eukprot:CAMPEP_0195281276 /NCGR_PEP_ID=MMETSP0707-20130614/656_1 /TAXON_ID=33640 /ORGANISM="Asterionellopsis glacialis, Strain CCMP134" /LENGTH=454 /DNA_ID=CAMNT_0040340149 /DNA_START=51 /DNA_END=1415 /DNA_ORIENTATION=-
MSPFNLFCLLAIGPWFSSAYQQTFLISSTRTRHKQQRAPWTLSNSRGEGDDLSWLQMPPPNPSKKQLTTPPSRVDSLEGKDPNDLGDVHIPSTGVSITDELEEAQMDKFISEFVPIKGMPGVAQIVTAATSWSFDPVRYLVALTPPPPPKSLKGDRDNNSMEETSPKPMDKIPYVMVDIPPYSPQLVENMKKFMGPNGHLSAILVTSRDAIHYDEAPSVFTTRKSDLDEWAEAFPRVKIVVYRLDVPRDCREAVTQRLDGYGPWALEESNTTFVETGRPLTYMEWDEETATGIMENGEALPDDEDQMPDHELYSPEAIRQREEGKRVLASYTPGHTFGSVSYVFPEMQVCVSGFTIPVEDNRDEENEGMEGAGPALDCRGYISTNKGGLARQMESARNIINTYGDRFNVVLPARGDPLYLDGDIEERKGVLHEIVDQYDKIGKLYEELGITSSD